MDHSRRIPLSGPDLCRSVPRIAGSCRLSEQTHFVLLCTIRTPQILGPQFTRYLVENAGSMKLVHYVVCCKLLGLPHELLQRHIWEVSKYTPYISKKRNFFRNFADIEPVQEICNFFDQEFGPLLNHKRQNHSVCPWEERQNGLEPCFPSSNQDVWAYFWDAINGPAVCSFEAVWTKAHRDLSGLEGYELLLAKGNAAAMLELRQQPRLCGFHVSVTSPCSGRC